MLGRAATRVTALQALVSLSTIGTQPDMSDAELGEACKAEMAEWFGADQVACWELLRVYRIPFAQPNQVYKSSCSHCKFSHLCRCASQEANMACLSLTDVLRSSCLNHQCQGCAPRAA